LQGYDQAQLALVISMLVFRLTGWKESKRSARRLQTCARTLSAHQKPRPDLADSFKNDVSYVEPASGAKKQPRFFDDAPSQDGPSFNWACSPKKSACDLGRIGVERDPWNSSANPPLLEFVYPCLKSALSGPILSCAAGSNGKVSICEFSVNGISCSREESTSFWLCLIRGRFGVVLNHEPPE
jgi:hypothetical protein